MSRPESKLLDGAIAIRKGLTKLLQWVVILLMVLLVFDVLWGVITRYAFGQQAKWSEELARVLLVWVSLFGASVAFGMKAHLGLDYFVGKLHPEAGRFNAIVGALISLAFAVVVFLYGGWALVKNTMDSGQLMIALPFAKWWGYAPLPISGIFMVVFLIEQLIEACLLPVGETLEEETV